MSDGPVRYEVREDVAYITLASPPHNILTIRTMRVLREAVRRAQEDRRLKAVALRAEGKNFSAGADVGEHAPEKAPALMAAFSELFTTLENLELPLVAAVQGAALGGGFELVLMADVVLAAADASFGQPEIRLAFIAPVGLARLPALVGPARAVAITASGRRYTAAEMERFGLVARVVAAPELPGALEEILADFRAASPAVMRLNVRTARRAAALPPSAARKEAVRIFLEELMPLADVREGIASFYEKRKPVWQNR